MLLSTAEEGSRLQFTVLRIKVMAKKNNIKKNDKLRQSDIETAFVIGGACFVICIIVFLIAVFNVYTSDCSAYITNFIKELG